MSDSFNNKKILFMGTPDFALASLRYLHENGANICGVVTQPDKPKGRGNKLCASEVKQYAQSSDLPVFQPESLKDQSFMPTLNELNPDVIVVVAYGKILPEYILSFPRYGCVNVHGSLLPLYRGAAPIQRAVLEGQTQTGVTTMLMDKGLDTGDMLLVEKLDIGKDDTCEQVFDRLAEIGGKLLYKTLSGLFDGTITPQKQDESKATYAQKLTADDEKIDFTVCAFGVHNKIRGLTSFPGAFALLEGKKIKLYSSTVYEGKIPENAVCGQVFFPNKKSVAVVCGQRDAVVVGAFKPEGKGILTSADMINGRKINEGDILK